MKRPTKLTIRSYAVGFGDCYLLSFHYAPDDARHVLIDFGSTGTPKGSKQRMLKIAEDIRDKTGRKLHAVVVTHRHADHISGFDPGSKGTGSGKIIAELKPDLVVQPWTEKPDLSESATKTLAAIRGSSRRHVASLAAMSNFSQSVLAEIKHLHQSASGDTVRQLAFVGEDNISNLDAVRNLIAMGKGKTRYVFYGSDSGLERVLPGVKVSVLGPPTPAQYPKVTRQRDEDPDEFWHLLGATVRLALASDAKSSLGLAARKAQPATAAPIEARWMVRRLQHLRAESLLELVTSLDNAMNNTSVILLFETSSPGRRKKRFLFPGDAQIENWEYALKVAPDKNANVQRLAEVDVYKVGHHGSLNATPMTLWNGFAKKRSKPGAEPLTSLVSTLAGKHGGKKKADTEVPRIKLVEALKKETNYFTTQDLDLDELSMVQEFPL